MAEPEQLNITVKSSTSKKYEFTVSPSSTVAELKDKIATEADIPTERQRLIYSGRVLKDAETLESYKIKSGHTIHLVKSAGPKVAGTTGASTASNSTNNGASASTEASANRAAGAPTNIATGTGSFNPLADLTGARYAGLAQLPSASMFGPDGGMGALPNDEDMERMLSNPMVQQSMNEMLRNPQMLDYLIQQSPQLRSMGPQVREMMQSDQFRQMLTNPQMMRQMRDMQRMFGGGAETQPAAFPSPGANPTTESTTDSSDTATGQPATADASAAAAANPFAALFPGGAPPLNPFSLFGNPQTTANSNTTQQPQLPAFDPALLQSLLGGGLGGTAQQLETDNRPPEERYESQLRQLNDMGFSDFERNVRALRRSGGNVQGAVENLLSEF